MDHIAEQNSVEATVQADGYVQLPEGVPALTTFYLYISGGCNLACRHCYIAPLFDPTGKKGDYVRLDHVAKAIAEAKPLGLRSAKLTGGEPTLHPQFRELVSLIAGEEINMIVETNGTLLDESLAHFMKENRVMFVSVSLDGANAESHEGLRGVKGSFDAAVSGIKALVSAGFAPQLICTLHQGNADEMHKVIELGESLGCGSIKFNLLQNMGRGERLLEEEGLEIAELIDLYNHLERDIRPNYNIRVFYDIPPAFQSIKWQLEDFSSCNVFHILGMLAGGNLALCGVGTQIPDLVYGHIETDNVFDVWCHSAGLTDLREKIPAQLEGICGECLHRNVCLGRCVANNFHTAQKLNAPYLFCDRADKLGLFPATRKK